MRELTGETFAEALTLCSQHSNFKVGIVFDSSKTLKEFMTDIKEIGEIPGIVKSQIRRCSGVLEFYNKSYIEIITCAENIIRGRKYNNVLYSYSKDMTDAEKHVLHGLEMPYLTNDNQDAADAVLFATEFGMMNEVSKIKNELKQMEDGTSEELDSFLSEFKVSDNCE